MMPEHWPCRSKVPEIATTEGNTTVLELQAEKLEAVWIPFHPELAPLLQRVRG
jgi:hypothetical protein